MKIENIKKNAFSMPFCSQLYPKSKFRFINREFLIITYETDIEALREVVPEPLKVVDPIVKYEFIRMPDSYELGDYTESGQVIPVEFEGKKGSYVHSMYLDNEPAIAAGREIWGFPKKYAKPTLKIESDCVVGELKYNSQMVALGTMGYKYFEQDKIELKKKLEQEDNFLLKIIPNCNGKDLDICQLVNYKLIDIEIKEAFTGPAALQLFSHALAPVAALPVKKIISGVHFKSNLTLDFGKVVFDYLKN
ncbi:acetoacetate decarboxylase [Rickettsiales bacterium LUAb2]